MTFRLAAWSLLLCVACATPSGPVRPTTPKAPPAADFYPLTLGTAWSYEVNLLGEKRVIEVKLLKQVAGGVEDSTGAQLTVDPLGVRDQRRYLLRNPVEVGTRWTNVVSVSAVERYEIIAVDQPCDAPAGRWTGCVVVQGESRVEEGKTLVNEMTFAPGVGLVQVATVLDNHGNHVPQSTLRLLSYTVGGAATPAPPAAR